MHSVYRLWRSHSESILGKAVLCSQLVLAFTLTCFPIQSEDLFMYLALAREYFRHGKFPSTDPFLYSLPDNSWTILHSWLSYFLFYGVYDLGGFDLIIFAKVILLLLCFLLPWFWLKKTPLMTGVWACSVFLALYASLFRFMERSSLLSDLLFLAVLNILLAEVRRPGKWKFLLPFLFLLWVNLHPGFPLGWALLGLGAGCLFYKADLKAKGRVFLQWAFLSLLSVAACFLNPRGWEGVLYPFKFMQEQGPVYRQYYYEWYSTLNPLFLQNPQTLFLAALILLNFYLLCRARKTKPLFEFVTSVLLIVYGLSAIRFVPLLCFSLVSINCALAATMASEKLFVKARVLLVVLALVLAGKNCVEGYDTISGHREVGLGFDIHVVPWKAVDFLREHNIQGPFFNSHLFGAYLCWALDSRKVFFHGSNTDIDFFLNDYSGFSKGPEDFEKLVSKYHIETFLIDRFAAEEKLISNILNSGQWDLVYKDEGSLIFIKKPHG